MSARVAVTLRIRKHHIEYKRMCYQSLISSSGGTSPPNLLSLQLAEPFSLSPQKPCMISGHSAVKCNLEITWMWYILMALLDQQCLSYLFGSLQNCCRDTLIYPQNVFQTAWSYTRILHFKNIPQQQIDDSTSISNS